jgi:ABC-type multidrug transport system fused ATPase/permease subunit
MIPLIRDLVRPYRWTLLVVFLAMLVETATSLAGPWPLKIILDNVVGSHRLPGWLAAWVQPVMGGVSKMHIAAMAAIAAIVIALVGAVASYTDNYFTESVGQRVANDLRLRAYHHLQRLSLAYYDTHQVGTILSTLTTDIGTIQTFSSSGTLSILIDIFTVIGMLGVMFWLNWQFALAVSLIMPFLLFFVSFFRKAVKKATKQVRTNEAAIVTVEEHGLESQRTIKAFGRQELEEERLTEASVVTVDSALKARRVKSLLSPLVAVTVSVFTALVLWRGAALILTGAMTAGVLTVLLSYLAKFFKPVQDLAKMTNSMAQTAVAVERIQSILQTDDIIPDGPDALDPEPFRGEVVFENVNFGYDAETPVLDGVSFSISPGQLVGLVGPTGSGKSTILNLIPRFYDATGGRLLIDGVDVRKYKVQGLRKNLGFVLQETMLFRGTVGENIAYGRPGATQEEIVEAAKRANADEFITRMAHGYDTMVGERGETLSGGQRQRIGIARAIIRNSPILLLDEPTAALDNESEVRVIEALERLMKGRTVIMIAHRLNTLRDADKIIVLKNGRIAEEGSHDRLLALDGVYAEIHKASLQAEPTKTNS